MRKIITLIGCSSLFALVLSCDNNDSFKEEVQREQQIQKSERYIDSKTSNDEPLSRGNTDSDLDQKTGKFIKYKTDKYEPLSRGNKDSDLDKKTGKFIKYKTDKYEPLSRGNKDSDLDKKTGK